MALVLADRVLETTSVAGTGDAALGGAQTGFQPFSVIGNGSTTYYTIVGVDDNHQPTGEWEVGIGTYVSTGNYISRDTVLSSSNGGAKVYFASGTKDIFLDLPSEEVLLSAGDVTGPASAVANNFAAFNMTTGKLIKDSGYNATSFATAAQGTLADTAIQPGDLGTAAYLDAGAANGVATLDAGGKVPTSQIPQMGDLNYQGTWNASTNSPTLTSSAGTKGFYYVVAVAGSTNLNGITDWLIGDWAVFNGSVWEKIDNTDAVTSVNGYTGTVVLTATDVGAAPATSGTSILYGNGTGGFSNVTVGSGLTFVAGTLASTGGGGTGDVVGPSSATDNAIARFDTTTGKLIQNSGVIIDDSNNVTGVNTLTATNIIVNDDTTLGGSNADSLAVNARITTDLEPATNNAKDIGTSGRNWRDGFFGRNLDTVNLSVTGTTSFDGSQGTSGQVLTSAGTGNTPTWTTPTTGTVTSVTGTAPVVSSGGATPAISLAASYGDTQNPYASKTANFVLAAPNGTAGVPTFRAVVAADIPTLNQNTTGTAANVTGTVAIINGGTGQTTALAAYNALSPMTTLGDITYEGAGGSALRLGIGSTNQVLTVVGGVPAWSTVASNVSSITFGTTGLTPNTATSGAVTVAGTLIGANGGTGQSTYAVGDLLQGGATNTLTKLAAVATGNALISGGVTTASSWGKIGLTTHVSGTLPIANGGTNSTATATNGGVGYGTGTAHAYTAAGTAGQVIVSNGAAAPTWQELTLASMPGAWTKKAVECATTANITLSGTQTIDGVAVIAGNRVLVKNQTTTSQNGIYVVAAGAWTRATDADAPGEIAGGTVSVDAGTVNGGGLFTTLFKSTDVVGTTAMLWYNVVDTSFAVTAGSTKTSSYVNYNGTTAAAGNFDGGTTTPTGATRLNYGGYFYPTFINLTGSSDTATAASHYMVETGSDGFVRPKTIANVRTELNVNTTSNLQINSLGVGTAASGTAGQIRATNSVTAYYSDARLKDFKGIIPNALAKVQALNGYYFTENAKAKELGYDNNKMQVGVSAQEVEAVLPEIVTEAPINANFEGADYKTVYYDKLVPLLIEAIKELKAEVDLLKGK